MVQFLSLHIPNVGGLSLILGQGTRSYMQYLRHLAATINKCIYIYIFFFFFFNLKISRAFGPKVLFWDNVNRTGRKISKGHEPRSMIFRRKISLLLKSTWTSLVAQMVKNLLSVQETWVQSLSGKDPLEKGMTTHSSILAWRIPWTQEPDGLLSMRSQRAGYD